MQRFFAALATALFAATPMAIAQSAAQPSEIPDDQWVSFMDGIDGPRIDGFAVHKRDPEKIVILTPDGVFSRNSKRQWISSSDGLPRQPFSYGGGFVDNSIFQGSKSDDQLFAIVSGKLFESLDFGAHWQLISGSGRGSTSVGFTNSNGEIECMDALVGIRQDPSNPNRILAGTINSAADGGLFITETGGAPWTEVSGSFARSEKCHGATAPENGDEVSARPPVPENKYLGRHAFGDSSLKDVRGGGVARECKPFSAINNDAWPMDFNFSSGGMIGLVAGPHPGWDYESNGVKRTVDGGLSWNKLITGPMCENAISAINYVERGPNREPVWLATAFYNGAYLSKTGEENDWTGIPGATFARLLTQTASGKTYALTQEDVGYFFYRMRHHILRLDPPISEDGLGGNSAFKEILEAPGGARSLYVIEDKRGEAKAFVVGTRSGGLWRYKKHRWENLTEGFSPQLTQIALMPNPSSGAMAAKVPGNGFFVRESLQGAWRQIGPGVAPEVADASISGDLRSALYTDGENVFSWRAKSKRWKAVKILPKAERLISSVQFDVGNTNFAYAAYSQGDEAYFARLRKSGSKFKIMYETALGPNILELGQIRTVSGAPEIAYLQARVSATDAQDTRSGIWKTADSGATVEPLDIGLSLIERAPQIIDLDKSQLTIVAYESPDGLEVPEYSRNFKSRPILVDTNTRAIIDISAQAEQAKHQTGWLQNFSTDFSMPMRLIANDSVYFQWPSGSSTVGGHVLCATGDAANLNWKDIGSLGLPMHPDSRVQEGHVISVSLTPFDSTVGVVSVLAYQVPGGLFARKIFGGQSGVPESCVTAAE